MGSKSSKNRRAVLKAIVALGSAAIGTLLAVPAVGYVADPLLRAVGRKRRWLRVAPLDALDTKQPRAFPVRGDAVDAWTRSERVRLGTVWLRREGDKVQAFNAECPHLGCKVAYDANAGKFACPCHDSSFSLSGDVQGGPAPRALDPLDARVVDGEVEVRFVRFRAQLSERVEIG